MSRISLEPAKALREKWEYKRGKTEVRYFSRSRNPVVTSLLSSTEVCVMYFEGHPIAFYHPDTKELYLTTCGYRTQAILNRFNAILTVFGLPTMYHAGCGKWLFNGSDYLFDGGMTFHLDRK